VRTNRIAAGRTVLVVLGALLLPQHCRAQEARKKMQDLIQQVVDKQPAAALIARQIGPSANTELIKLTRHDDAEVRLVAAYCLDETGGVDAAVAFARLALDGDGQVRAAALQGLIHHRADVQPQNLLDAFDQSRVPYVRQQLMLIAAKVPGVGTPEIQKRNDAEKDAQAREGLLVALGERGNRQAQAEYTRDLDASKGRDRARFLEYAEQINQAWLLPALLPILDDKTPLVWIGIDGLPQLPQSLRACDIAISLASEISGHRFRFQVAKNVNYTDPQIAEAKAFLQQIK